MPRVKSSLAVLASLTCVSASSAAQTEEARPPVAAFENEDTAPPAAPPAPPPDASQTPAQPPPPVQPRAPGYTPPPGYPPGYTPPPSQVPAPGQEQYPGAYWPPPGYPPDYQPGQPAPPTPPPYAAAPVPPPPPEAPHRSVSLYLSPGHLLLATLEVTAEIAAGDLVGIGLIAGIGAPTVKDGWGSEIGARVYEAGGQVLFYPFERFENVHFGAELLYLHVEAHDINDTSIRGVGAGLAIGPFFGYKLLTESGFSLVVQSGVQHLSLQAETADATSAEEINSDSKLIALLNLGIGWSF